MKTRIFYKYQGTGNDFIIMDNRDLSFNKNNTSLVKDLCDRRFGIGADGLILLENHEDLDFTMVYYNSDGQQSSMCGNGGRCIVAFAKFLKLIESETSFMAIDGEHLANIKADGIVELQMQDVLEINEFDDHMFLNTGSPHHVEMIHGIDEFKVKDNGAKIRFGELYKEEGSNINFVEKLGDDFRIRTYERGVENETLSCGTGATAVALAMNYSGQTSNSEVSLLTQGGPLKVRFDRDGQSYKNVWLIGPATQVFKGEVSW